MASKGPETVSCSANPLSYICLRSTTTQVDLGEELQSGMTSVAMSRRMYCKCVVAATWGGSFACAQVTRRHLFLAVLLVFIEWSHTPFAVAKAGPESDVQLIGARVLPELGLEEPPMEATVDDREPEIITYSVILVAKTIHCSNLFRDQERVNAFNAEVVSVTSTRPYPSTTIEDRPGQSPFSQGHPDGVDKRVRIVYLADFGGTLSTYQVSDHNYIFTSPKGALLE